MVDGVNYKFKLVIRDEDKTKYVIYINRKKGQAHIGYLKTTENIDVTTKIMIDLDSEYYNKFFNTALPMLDKWRKVYTGNINKNKWSIVLNESGKETKYKGSGDYPKNWNELIDLVTEYELLYKNNGKPYKEEKEEDIEDGITREISLEYMVSGAGKYESTEMSGLRENDEFTFGNSKGTSTVKVLNIYESKAVLEFTKDLELGFPVIDKDKLKETQNTYIVECNINEEVVFDSFIPLYKYKITLTGIYDVIKNYYED